VPAVFQGIDPATVAAYERLGAIYGTMGPLPALDFHIGRDQAEKGLPGFRFLFAPPAKLPQVAVPFGLDLPTTTAAELKNLAGLKNLIALRISGVTDVRLKDLAALKNLTALDLSVTGRQMGAELKELAALKNLTALRIGGVTEAGIRALREIGFLRALPGAKGKNGKIPKTDEEVVELNLRDVRGVTDAGLKELARFKNLTGLDLAGTLVVDAGLKELACHKNLTSVNLAATPVTDAGLRELAVLKNLTTLNLDNTRVTDAGLKELAVLKNLTSLDLRNTEVSFSGVISLRGKLPKCKITY
jgi:Leucine-rich repeat (LRR) protein